MQGSHLPHAKFSLQYIKFSLRYAMENMFDMFSSVTISKFELACMHTRPLKSLETPYLYRACAPSMHAHDVHSRHDVTRFANKANYVIIASFAFVFHSCHVGMRWHDVIGVHVHEHHVIMVCFALG